MATATATPTREDFAALRAMLPVLAAGLFVSALMTAFYAATGLIVARVAYAMVPPLLAIAGSAAIVTVRRLEGRARWALGLGCFLIAVTQTAIFILKMPPNL